MLCCVLGGARIFIEQNHFTRTTYVEYAESEHGVTFLALACFGLVDLAPFGLEDDEAKRTQKYTHAFVFSRVPVRKSTEERQSQEAYLRKMSSAKYSFTTTYLSEFSFVLNCTTSTLPL
eukprot:scaffold13383_cov310-Alexandrium_tamarense.AAC.4